MPLATLTAQVRHFESRFRIIEDSAAVTAALFTLLEGDMGRRERLSCRVDVGDYHDAK